MKAIILAAGVGSRLRPITDHMPKSLIQVGNKKVLDYQIEGYLSAGLNQEDINIVTGYRSEDIAKYLKEKYPRVKIVENREFATTNNMYSLYLAINTLEQNRVESLFINNADCIYDYSIIKQMVESPNENLIACKKDVYIEESMKVTVSGDRIVNISKQIHANDAYGVSLDLYKFGSATFVSLKNIISRIIEKEKKINLWTELSFPELFTNSTVLPIDTKNLKWVEIDNKEDLLLADSIFSTFDVSKKKAMLCDLDGTLYIGETPIASAVNYINENPNDLDQYFFSNNTSRTPQQFVEKLNRYGVTTKADRIITPLLILIKYLRDKDYKSVYLVANESVKTYLREQLPSIDFEFDVELNQLVVLTYDTEISYNKMKNASILLNRRNVPYWATHTDIYCPNESGPIPDIGSFIKLFEVTTGRLPDMVLGKPSAFMLEPLLEHYSPEELFLVGDRVYTDMRMAHKVGCDFVCVLSGETDREDLAILDSDNGFPSIIVNALGEVPFN